MKSPYQGEGETKNDIDPTKGFLSHFFNRESGTASDPGRVFFKRALDKQKQFDKIFLKHIIAGERERLQRINGRSTSVARE